MTNMLKHTNQMEQYLIESCSARALAVTLEKILSLLNLKESVFRQFNKPSKSHMKNIHYTLSYEFNNSWLCELFDNGERWYMYYKEEVLKYIEIDSKKKMIRGKREKVIN